MNEDVSIGSEPVMQRITRFLEDARRELIDISRRNRLLHSPRSIDRTPRRGAADNNGGSAGGPSRTVRSHCLELQGVDLDAAFGTCERGRASVLPQMLRKASSPMIDRAVGHLSDSEPSLRPTRLKDGCSGSFAKHE